MMMRSWRRRGLATLLLLLVAGLSRAATIEDLIRAYPGRPGRV